MIVSLRGTNGSGKSTIVREVMKSYLNKVEIHYPGRKKPMGYIMVPRQIENTPHLFVPGHYEIANGGVDTIHSLSIAYDLIVKHADLKFNVLYEGKNMSDGCRRLLNLHSQGLPVAVACIELPIRDCIAAVRMRGHFIKVETIQRLARKSVEEMKTFKEEGVPCFSGSRDQVLGQVRSWLKL